MKASTLVLCAFVALTTAACVTTGHHNEMPSSTALAPMQKPRINVGDKWHGLMNDKQIVVTTDSLDQGVVRNRRSDGCRWTTIAWGFAPVSQWSGCGGSAGRREITVVKGEVWPLQVGRKVKYSYRASNQSGSSWKGTQTCKVTDQVRIQTVSGTHDTFKVVCDDPWTTHVWYVSPKTKTTVYLVRYRRKKNETTKFEMVKFEKAGQSS